MQKLSAIPEMDSRGTSDIWTRSDIRHSFHKVIDDIIHILKFTLHSFMISVKLQWRVEQNHPLSVEWQTSSLYLPGSLECHYASIRPSTKNYLMIGS